MKLLMYNTVAFFLLLGMVACQNEMQVEAATKNEIPVKEDNTTKPIQRNPERIVSKDGLSVPYYQYENFQSFLEAENDTTYVINFWATWCGPCVAELPYFEELYKNYKDQKVRLVLVSLDFDKQLESKLIPFLQKNQLEGEVLVLSQKNVTKWIDKIDPQWSGAIPATIIYNQKHRKFYEQTFDYEKLETALKEALD